MYLSWGTAPSFPQAKNPEALIYGRRIRLASAAASGYRLSLRGSKLWGIAPSLPQAKNPEALIYGRRIRLASAAASGRRPCRPVASGCRFSLPYPSWGTASSLPRTKNPEALIYGRRIRLACRQRVVGHSLESSEQEESGGSNLWPTDSCGLRGSSWPSALPTRSS